VLILIVLLVIVDASINLSSFVEELSYHAPSYLPVSAPAHMLQRPHLYTYVSDNYLSSTHPSSVGY
jgi:hypothetical protein